jgi:hypothetical protein
MVIDVKKINTSMHINEVTGHIPKNEKEANDPRYKTGLTQDVGIREPQKQAKKFGNSLDDNGLPPLLNTNGNLDK